MRSVTLLVPGLLGPMPAMNTLPCCQPLQTWLSRGVRHSQCGEDYFQTLAYLLAGETGLSMAQASAQADGIGLPGLLRADPVHFRADRDKGVLIPGPLLAIREHEARALVEAFNSHFAADGIQLNFAHPQRWYVSLSEPLAIQTTHVYEASGRDLQSHLPVGEQGLRWRQILNETQMLFFQHPVNQAREASGQLSINSLWLWGEGEAPQKKRSGFSRVYADDIHARGLSELLGIGCRPLADSLLASETHGESELLVYDAMLEPASRGDIDAWRSAFEHFCHDLVEPLQQRLQQSGLNQLILMPADGDAYHITRARLRRFWLRPKSMQHWMHVYD